MLKGTPRIQPSAIQGTYFLTTQLETCFNLLKNLETVTFYEIRSKKPGAWQGSNPQPYYLDPSALPLRRVKSTTAPICNDVTRVDSNPGISGELPMCRTFSRVQQLRSCIFATFKLEASKVLTSFPILGA